MTDSTSLLPQAWAKLAPYLMTGLAQNALGVTLCVGWVVGLLLFAAWAQRRFDLPLWATHWGLRMAASFWVVIAFFWISVGNVAWMASWTIPFFLAFVNARGRTLSFTQNLYDSEMPTMRPLANPWPVLLLVFFWWKPGLQFIVISGVLASELGMGAAAIVNRRWGKHRFRFRGARRLTFEGFVAMAAVTLVVVFLAVLGAARIPDWHVPRLLFGAWALFGAMLTTAVASVAYLYTPRPYENWSVPLGAALVIYYYAVSGFHI
jgi:dolichol kinase